MDMDIDLESTHIANKGRASSSSPEKVVTLGSHHFPCDYGIHKEPAQSLYAYMRRQRLREIGGTDEDEIQHWRSLGLFKEQCVQSSMSDSEYHCVKSDATGVINRPEKRSLNMSTFDIPWKVKQKPTYNIPSRFKLYFPFHVKLAHEKYPLLSGMKEEIIRERTMERAYYHTFGYFKHLFLNIEKFNMNDVRFISAKYCKFIVFDVPSWALDDKERLQLDEVINANKKRPSKSSIDEPTNKHKRRLD